MTPRIKLGIGLLCLVAGIGLGWATNIEGMTRTCDSVVSFLSGACIGISLPLTISGFLGMRKG